MLLIDLEGDEVLVSPKMTSCWFSPLGQSPAAARRSVIGLLAVAVVLHSLPGRAATEGEGTSGARAKAMRIAKAGVSAYDADHYTEALGKFEQAYKAYQAPSLLSNLSHTELKLGRCSEARNYAKDFADQSTTAATRAMANSWLAQVDAQCPEIRLTSEPPGASVWLDVTFGDPIGVTPLTVRVLSGAHTLRFHLSGFDDHREQLMVEAGKSLSIHDVAFIGHAPPPAGVVPPPSPVTPVPPVVVPLPSPVIPPPAPVVLLQTPPPAVAAPAPALPTSPKIAPEALRAKEPESAVEAPRARPRPWKTVGWSTLAVGAAALIVGAAVGVNVNSQTSAYEHANTRNSTQTRTLFNSINEGAVGANVCFVAGGILAATGTGLVVAF